MQGSGTFKYQDGRSYEGEFFNDKKNGYGVFQWPNGRLYDGYWINGREEGAGILFNEFGEVKYFKFVEGKRERILS